MSINIKSDLPVPVNLPGQQKPAQTKSAAETATSTATRTAVGGGVALTMSNAARELEKAGTGDVAEVDTQKVASVRSAIADGTYVVNPEAIADKLLANAQEMLNRTTN